MQIVKAQKKKNQIAKTGRSNKDTVYLHLAENLILLCKLWPAVHVLSRPSATKILICNKSMAALEKISALEYSVTYTPTRD